MTIYEILMVVGFAFFIFSVLIMALYALGIIDIDNTFFAKWMMFCNCAGIALVFAGIIWKASIDEATNSYKGNDTKLKTTNHN